MRINQPVSQREFPFPEGVTLMSKTDAQSRVTYANDAFVNVSGFSRDEIIGQPHNVVRHPDMPPEAFADMWETLKRGRAWTAIVKNRRKDGDHYWVRANATPIRHGGVIKGYMSVRSKPREDEIAAADSLYARLRSGSAKGLAFREGIVVRTGWRRWQNLLKVTPARICIRAALGTTVLVPVSVAAAFGVGGMPLAVAGASLLVSAAAAALLLERQLAGPLASLLKQAQGVANGERPHAVVLDRIDEIGLLMRAVNQIGLSRNALVDDVYGRACRVNDNGAAIADGNQDLSRRTELQASAIEQTAASMEQLNSTVKQNADNAREADDLAREASSVAVRAGEVVGGFVETMKGINESSRRIGDIIGVIDGIAFQTNILALNAAVEAARAGEQGRGFAVVAGEVRSLAGRSADAAREVKSLIASSVERVDEGSRQVDRAGATMNEVVNAITRVTELMGAISAASREQSTGVAQVGEAIHQLDQVTQQNAALVEGSAAAAETLKQQAHALVEVVAAFMPGTEPGAAAISASPRRAATEAIRDARRTRSAEARDPAAAARATGSDSCRARDAANRALA